MRFYLQVRDGDRAVVSSAFKLPPGRLSSSCCVVLSFCQRPLVSFGSKNEKYNPLAKKQSETRHRKQNHLQTMSFPVKNAGLDWPNFFSSPCRFRPWRASPFTILLLHHTHPGGVGFDINCGVRLVRTNLTLEDILPVKEELTQSLFDHIPVGVGTKGVVPIKAADLNDVLVRESAVVVVVVVVLKHVAGMSSCCRYSSSSNVRVLILRV